MFVLTLRAQHCTKAAVLPGKRCLVHVSSAAPCRHQESFVNSPAVGMGP